MRHLSRYEKSRKAKNIIEVVGTFPNSYGLCWSCMPVLKAANIKPVRNEIKEIPKNVQDEYSKTSNILKWINEEFSETFIFRLIDGYSMIGFWRCLRHRIKKTPCLIYHGKKVVEGINEKGKIIALIKKALEET